MSTSDAGPRAGAAEPGEMRRDPADLARRTTAPWSSACGDYMRKTGFKKALLGLSGGIDSAIVAAIAADALGPENVRCVMLPSELHLSQQSLDDAAAVGAGAGLPAMTRCRSPGRKAAVGEALAPLFAGHQPGHHRREHPVAACAGCC